MKHQSLIWFAPFYKVNYQSFLCFVLFFKGQIPISYLVCTIIQGWNTNLLSSLHYYSWVKYQSFIWFALLFKGKIPIFYLVCTIIQVWNTNLLSSLHYYSSVSYQSFIWFVPFYKRQHRSFLCFVLIFKGETPFFLFRADQSLTL